MKIRFLLLGTSLSFIPQTINAQCVATQDCATLGYTETSCSGSSGVKCPFGNKWACFKSDSEIKDQLCTELGFTQTCTGIGYSGGSGKACNGKYSECTCASGYEWKDNSCQKTVLNGAHGNFYYCNDTIVGVKTSGINFYIALKNLRDTEINIYDAYDAINYDSNHIFCDNIRGNLPTKEQLKSIYNNKSSINNLLITNGGTKLTEGWYWSSSIYGNEDGEAICYRVNMSNGSTDTEYVFNWGYGRAILDSN